MSESARAKVYGAVSLVNAIAAKKGATLGVELTTEATITKSPGTGIFVEHAGRIPGEKLIVRTVEKSVSKSSLKSHRVDISLKTQIPTGYGLKSSSSVSTAVALACARVFSRKIDDCRVIRAGVNASIETGVSITGAYDDACACYYGGFCVTNNRTKRMLAHKKSPSGLYAAIYVPYKRARANPKKLAAASKVFSRAWKMALEGQYWNAMILNGVAASSMLNTDPALVGKLVGAGALGASVSGNGPAVAAVAEKRAISGVAKKFPSSQGRVITVPVNCKKASVHDL